MCVTLRSCACKFVTEWGIPDLQGAIEDVWGEFWWDYWNLDEEIGPYQWWEEALAEGVPIPESPYVWHYHPVAVLQQLWHEGYGAATEPTFFVEREGEEVEVEYPSLLNDDGTIEDVLQLDSEDVYVREKEDAEAWKIGESYADKRYGNYDKVGVGLFNYDSNRNLYDILINRGVTDGIPDLNARDRHTWASLYYSEGGLFAHNTWDIGMLSFGVFQQTAGKPNDRGELQGALAYVKEKNEALFERYFRQYGLDVTGVEEQLGVNKGRFILDGTTLTSKRQKWQLRAFKWTWRFHQAMDDVEFRKLFMEHGFSRLDIVRGLKEEVGGQTRRLDEVYRSELAHALLVDLHINAPAHLDTVWTGAADQVLSEQQFQNLGNSSIVTDEDEKALCKAVIEWRNGEHTKDDIMTNPDGRAAHIVLCLEGLDDALAQDLGYGSVSDIGNYDHHDFLQPSR